MLTRVCMWIVPMAMAANQQKQQNLMILEVSFYETKLVDLILYDTYQYLYVYLYIYVCIYVCI